MAVIHECDFCGQLGKEKRGLPSGWYRIEIAKSSITCFHQKVVCSEECLGKVFQSTIDEVNKVHKSYF